MKKLLEVVHIDDDPDFLDLFKIILSKHPDIDYRQGFTSVRSAYEYIKISPPDLVFLDVEMPEENGFGLIEHFDNPQTDIVFVFSHTGYIAKAFEACAMDYIVKPVSEKKLSNFLNRYRLKQSRYDDHLKEQIRELYSNYLEEQNKPTRIFISTVGKIVVAALSDILYFASKDNYTEIFMADGTKHTSGKGIKTYEEAIVRSRDFIRIHRSFIINKLHVKIILRDSRKQRFAVVMSNNDELEMSYLKKDEILEALKK